MCRTRIVLAALFLAALLPTASQAIDLRWSSGGSAISFESATRCTLFVYSTGAEGSLPTVWRLVWIAEGTDVHLVPAPGGAGCDSEVAVVSSVLPPSCAADLLAHASTAALRGSECGPGTRVQFVVDLAEGSRGKFKFVGLDPSDPDSNEVLESPVASFNGGLDDSFPPVALRTATDHHSTSFTMTAVGSGLAGTAGVNLADPNGGWQLPVAITTRSDTRITAAAQLAAEVPACLATIAGGAGFEAVAVPADPPPPPLEPEGPTCQRDSYFEQLPTFDQNQILPRDFAFIPGGWTPQGQWSLHLFYGRMNLYTKQFHGGANATQKNFGHAATFNILEWHDDSTHIDTVCVKVRPGFFDNGNVYAPNIVKDGLTYYMFYAAEDTLGDQRIGLATSTDLINWTQRNSPVLDWSELGSWAAKKGPQGQSAAQLRDPFVMPDPGNPGQWLMYYVTTPADHPDALIVGVSRWLGDFSHWDGGFGLYSTLHANTGPPYGFAHVESPAVFRSQDGKWWLFYTPQETGQVYGIVNPTSPTDQVVSNWSAPDSLDGLIVDIFNQPSTGSYSRWHAMEPLAIGSTTYLSAWDDLNRSIDFVAVTPWSAPALFRERCPLSNTGVADGLSRGLHPRLSMPGACPATSSVALRIEIAHSEHVTLAVYDVAGRRVKLLLDRKLPGGVSECTWDGRGQGGAAVRKGIYFICLQTAGTRATIRTVLLP